MTKRHRSAHVGLFVATAVLLAACSSTPGSNRSSQAAASGSSNPSGQLRVAMVSQVEGIPYFAGFKQGAEAAAKDLGVSYTQVGPSKVDSTEQVRVLDNLVSQGYDAIGISPLDPTSINASIQKARQAGIAVATSDADAPASARQVFVSQATDQALGTAVMDALAKGMNKSGKYAIVSGSADTATFNSWIKYAEERQKQAYPDITLVGGVRHALDSAAALSAAQNLITAFPDLKGIIAVPSNAVPGVGQAVTNAGKIGKISVTGFGSPKTAGPFLKSGAMTSTVLWDVTKLGYLTVWAMFQLTQDKPFQAENKVPGFDQPIAYDAKTKTLLLGEPKVFTKDDYEQYDF